MARKPKRGAVEQLAERRRQAIRCKQAGMTYRDIAARLGVSVRTAFLDVQEVLSATRTETIETKDEMVQLETLRLEELHFAIWPRVVKGELSAIDRALHISRIMRKLYGLDAPPHAGYYKAEAEREARSAKQADGMAERELLKLLTDEELEQVHKARQILDNAKGRSIRPNSAG